MERPVKVMKNVFRTMFMSGFVQIMINKFCDGNDSDVRHE